MLLSPFIRVDDTIALHLARTELATPVFELIDRQRDYLRQWLPWVDATRSAEDTRTFMLESIHHNSQGTRLTTFITADNQLAGSLGVVHFNKDHRKCEVGYWLREDFQGRGIMTRACAAFINHLFRSKDLNRIEILAASANEKSRAIPLRLGFHSEGILRQSLLLRGRYLDVELFALLRADWQEASHLIFNQKI
jgi:ribosomal-protein-serine acetyltransferase